MSLRIACDLDGTLADMNAALEREAAAYFWRARRSRWTHSGRFHQRDATSSGGGRCRRDERMLADGERSRLWSHVREIDNFWETLPEIEPARWLGSR